ncbi:MAG TPA: hypothetical protein VMI31_04560 [Fimbriimonadaceae bacterium]|nr:hypothetical protein [Fimbriimonadaceae bacterium]
MTCLRKALAGSFFLVTAFSCTGQPSSIVGKWRPDATNVMEVMEFKCDGSWLEDSWIPSTGEHNFHMEGTYTFDGKLAVIKKTRSDSFRRSTGWASKTLSGPEYTEKAEIKIDGDTMTFSEDGWPMTFKRGPDR